MLQLQLEIIYGRVIYTLYIEKEKFMKSYSNLTLLVFTLITSILTFTMDKPVAFFPEVEIGTITNNTKLPIRLLIDPAYVPHDEYIDINIPADSSKDFNISLRRSQYPERPYHNIILKNDDFIAALLVQSDSTPEIPYRASLKKIYIGMSGGHNLSHEITYADLKKNEIKSRKLKLNIILDGPKASQSKIIIDQIVSPGQKEELFLKMPQDGRPVVDFKIYEELNIPIFASPEQILGVSSSQSKADIIKKFSNKIRAINEYHSLEKQKFETQIDELLIWAVNQLLKNK